MVQAREGLCHVQEVTGSSGLLGRKHGDNTGSEPGYGTLSAQL